MTARPGAFDSDLSIQAAGPIRWKLIAPLVWTGTRGDRFIVPIGFSTDFASVPRVLHWLVLPYGPYTRAAVLHDWLISARISHPDPFLRVTSRDVDGIFRRAMDDLGVGWALRWTMWAAVRWSSLTTPSRRNGRDFLADAPRVFALTLVAGIVVLPGVIGVLISLGIVRLSTRERPTDMALFNRYPLARDIAERVLATFVVTVLGVALTDLTDIQNGLTLQNWRGWITAGVIAVLTLAKTLLASRIGKNPSASLDPAVKLQPSGPAGPAPRHGAVD